MQRWFWALFALFSFCAVPAADDVKRITGVLLVARAELPDPNFRDSVVFVTNQSKLGPVGVIVNKPTIIPVSRLFPDIEKLAQLDDKVHFGGPLATDSVSFLFRADEAPAHAGVMEVFSGVYFSVNQELLAELLRRDKPMAGLRIFLGHSSWGPGQLEGEVARKDWTLTAANARAIFETPSEQLWLELQGRSSGQRISFVPS
jgi:putative transcriptional regulator